MRRPACTAFTRPLGGTWRVINGVNFTFKHVAAFYGLCAIVYDVFIFKQLKASLAFFFRENVVIITLCGVDYVFCDLCLRFLAQNKRQSNARGLAPCNPARLKNISTFKPPSDVRLLSPERWAGASVGSAGVLCFIRRIAFDRSTYGMPPVNTLLTQNFIAKVQGC